jgi:hypothetical protein
VPSRTPDGDAATVRPFLLLLHDGRSMPQATSRALAGAVARRDLGLLVVSPQDWPSLRAELPCTRVWEADPRDPGAVGETLDRAGFDAAGLVGVGTLTEPVVPTAAAVAAAHGLPGPSPRAAARTASDKLAMRSALSEACVPAPAFAALERLDPGEVADALRRFGGPGVVKPRAGEGSAGVVLVELGDDLERRLALAERGRRAAGAGGLPGWLVERYVPGALVSVDGFVTGGGLRPVGVTETELSPPPFFVLERNWLPARLDAALCARATEVVGRAVRAFGLDDCAVHAEVRVDGDEALVLEVAARLPGGQLPAAYGRAFGVDLVEAQVALWLGEPIDVEPRHRIQVHQRGEFPRIEGVVRHAHGGLRAAGLAGVWQASTCAPGQEVPVPPDPTVPLCYLGVEGLDAVTVKAVMERAVSAIDVAVEPSALRGVAGGRLPWAAVPWHVADSLARASGADVAAARDLDTGGSPASAVEATLADGRRVFGKVAGGELDAETARLLREEVRAAMVVDVAWAPRLLAHVDDGRWVGAFFAFVDGRSPQLSPAGVGLAPVLDDLATYGKACAPAGLPTLHDRFDGLFGAWGRLATDGAVGGAADGIDPWCAGRLDDLAALEARWPEAVTGDALVHGDLRLRHVLTGRRGTWLVDWSRAAAGCGWFDLLCLLVDACAHGAGDVDAVFRAHPLGAPADGDAVDSVLAALAGWLTERASTPAFQSSPGQRVSEAGRAAAATRWLRQRRLGR